MTREFETLSIEEFVVPPPAQAPTAVPGVTGVLPRKAGESGVMRPEFLLPEEQKVLAAAGYKPGDPIPTNLAKILSPDVEAAKSSVTRANLSPPDGANQFSLPPETPVSSLPPERQAEVKAALSRASQMAAAMDAVPQDNASSLQIDQEINLVDDTPQTAPFSPTPPQGQQEGHGHGTASPDPRFSANATGASSVMTMPYCPHCNWDLSVPDVDDPDEETRKWYLHAVLGVIPFEKSFSLMDGALELTFRELEFEDLERIYQQVRDDLKDKYDVITEADFKEAINRYRVAMQLTRIWMGNKGHTIPHAAGYSMPALLQAVTKLLNNTSLYRIVRMQLVEFNRLIAKLEVGAARENFWKAALAT